MSYHEISLKWNGYQSNILNKVRTLFHEEQTSDVTLVSQGLNFRAHKIILSANSGVFKSIFEQNPYKDPIIVLHDLNTEALKKLLVFMYCGEVNVTETFLPTLLKTADTLRICGLSSGITFEELETTPASKKRKQDKKLVNKTEKSKETIVCERVSEVILKEEPSEPVSCDISCLINIENNETTVDKTLPNPDTTTINSEELINGKEEKVFPNWINDVVDTPPLIIDESVSDIKSDLQDKDNVEKYKDGLTQDSASEDYNDKSAALYENPSFPCPFCPRVYNSWGYRRRHVKSRHITNQLSCKFCRATHATQASWYAHATRAHGMSAEDARNSLVVMVEAHAVLTPVAPDPSVAQLLDQVDLPVQNP